MDRQKSLDIQNKFTKNNYVIKCASNDLPIRDKEKK